LQKLKRGIHIDFHTLPGIYNFGEGFDAEVFAQRLQDAHVEIINAFFQCNIGHVYYPTKIGVPYPAMQGDMFGDLVRACHKRGIRVVGYTNTAINHTQALLHPDWQRVDSEGRVRRENTITSSFFRTMCYNNDGYRNYLSALIKEVIELYDIDGIFADCMTPSPLCHCAKCTRDMLAEGLDVNNENHVRYFAYKKFYEFAHMIRDAVPEGKLVQQTGVPFDWDGAEHVSTHGELECLPAGRWGYDFFVPQVAYMRKCRDQILYMSGRFHYNWGDFGGYKSVASMENDCYDALSQGVQVSIGDHMHPAGNLDEKLYKDIGNIYARIKAYEPWTDSAVYRSEIGILNDKTVITKEEMRGGLGRNVSVRGAARMLAELKYGFDILNEDMDFTPYQVLILPDEIYMSDQLKDKLSAYLAKGGKVISSGTAGLNCEKTDFACKEWNFIHFEGMDDHNVSFFTNELYTRPIAMYRQGIRMSSEYKTAEYIKPYFNRHFDGIHGYRYVPPEKTTGQAAIAEKDNVCHICFRMFESYYFEAYHVHKLLLSEILQRFIPNPLLRTEGIPSTARVTLTGTDAYELLHIKTTYPEKRGDAMNLIEEHVMLPAGKTVYVRGHFSAAYLLPDKKPVSIETDGIYTNVTLPEITGYAMILLDK